MFGGPLGGASGYALKFYSYFCSGAFDIYMLTGILDTDYTLGEVFCTGVQILPLF
jgi:hypothetical protein